MSDATSGSIDFGHPDKTGGSWQFGLRPAESLDAAEVEIVSTPESPGSPDATDSHDG
jgi:hypothetical protein